MKICNEFYITSVTLRIIEINTNACPEKVCLSVYEACVDPESLLSLLLKLWAVKGTKVLDSLCLKKCSSLSSLMFLTITVQMTRKTARNEQWCEFRRHIFNVQPSQLSWVFPCERLYCYIKRDLEKNEQLDKRKGLIQSRWGNPTRTMTKQNKWSISLWALELLLLGHGVNGL